MRWGLVLAGVVGLVAWIGWWRRTPDDEVSPHWLDQREKFEMDHELQVDGPAWKWPLRTGDDRDLEDEDQRRRKAFGAR